MARKSAPWFRAGRGWYTTLKGKQTKLGDFPPDDIRAARDALDKLLTNNQTPEPAPQPADDWRALVEEWLALKAKKKLKPKTLADYRWNLDRFLAEFGHATRAEITAEALAEHAESFGWGNNQRRHYLGAAAAFLDWCGHPLKVERPVQKSAGAERIITEATHAKAVAAAGGDVGPLLDFLWHTGARPLEACNLTAEEVDWSAGVATLREHKTSKKGHKRLLYLSAQALDVLTAQRDKHGSAGPLFRNRFGAAFSRAGLTETVRRIAGKIGAKLTAYGYRHSYATRALELGLPDVHVAALLGHSSTKMIHAHYSHLDANARLLKDAAARIAGPPDAHAA